jgi:glutamate-1-semialdehyde aminotransferase
MGSTIEVEAAERLKGLFPFIDKVKFLKTGTEACMAAVKIARAFTGREKILVDGYHGWSDIFIGPPGFGVDLKAAGNTHRGTNYTDHVLKLARGDYAAVVLEPVEIDNSPSRRQWLQELRTVCDNTGTLLIFDEVITGFRFPGMSVSKYHGITPDLICLGKAMGGGLPLSAVGGKTHIMECKEYFVSSTFAGDTLALSAFLEVCDMFNTVKYSIDDLWVKGEQFLERFNELAPDKIQLRGYPTRGAFFGNEEFKYAFWQEAARAGILFGPSWFYGFASPEHDDATLSVCKDIINKVRTRKNTFTGIPPLKPFASKQRE